MNKSFADQMNAAIWALWNRGYSIKQIGARTGVQPRYIRVLLAPSLDKLRSRYKEQSSG